MKPLFKSDLDEILETSRDDLMALRGGRVFITGGTGFFGKWIVESLMHARERLLDGKLELTVLTRSCANARRVFAGAFGFEEVSWHEGDVATFAPPAGAFSHVIHAATPARASLNDNDPLKMLEITISGTRRVLEFARRASCSRFLLTSSGAVYGPQPPDLYGIPEDFRGYLDSMDPKNAYAIGKLTSEHLCRHFASDSMPSGDLACLIARCFAFVGPGLPLDEHFAIGNFIGDALAGRKIIIQGDGSPYRSYLYPTDLMAQLLAILVRGESCRPYNVGSPTAYSIREVAAETSAQTDVGTETLGKPQPGARAARYVPDISRVMTELNLKPRVDLTHSIRRTLLWHRGRS
jgi:dTDP-glucose 4,6-dehydratase